MSPIQLDPNHQANRFEDTTLEQAMVNTGYAVTQQVAQMNASLKTGYLTTFDNWAQSVIAGRADNSNPPRPPNAYGISAFTDPTNNKAAWAYPAVGNTPVCDMPPLPTVAPPQVQVHSPGNESVMNVPPGDTWPTGTILTAPDGGKWQKVTRATPWGIAQLYQHVG